MKAGRFRVKETRPPFVHPSVHVVNMIDVIADNGLRPDSFRDSHEYGLQLSPGRGLASPNQWAIIGESHRSVRPILLSPFLFTRAVTPDELLAPVSAFVIRVSGVDAGTPWPYFVRILSFKELTIVKDIMHTHDSPTTLRVRIVFLAFHARSIDKRDPAEGLPIASIVASDDFTLRLVPGINV